MVEEFKITVAPTGVARLCAITELAFLDLQTLHPIRAIKNYPGQVHIGGWYWFSKSRSLLRFESGLERLRLMFLDFDPQVISVVTQPLMLQYREEKKWHAHIPDNFVARRGRCRLIEDVKPKKWKDHPRYQSAFQATQELCQLIGLEYSIWSEPSTLEQQNVRWLAGFRRTPNHFARFSEALITQLSDGELPLAELCRAAGPEYWTRPALFHLIWTGQLRLDIQAHLTDHTLIFPGKRDS